MDKKLSNVDVASLTILCYPDPRLRERSTAVEDPTDPAVAALAAKMFELMSAARGVGLAADGSYPAIPPRRSIDALLR